MARLDTDGYGVSFLFVDLWCGDDTLVFATRARGGKQGQAALAHGATSGNDFCLGFARRQTTTNYWSPQVHLAASKHWTWVRQSSYIGFTWSEENLEFVRHSIERDHCAHATCTTGDINGDGRPDLIVGEWLSEDGASFRVFLNFQSDARLETSR